MPAKEHSNPTNAPRPPSDHPVVDSRTPSIEDRSTSQLPPPNDALPLPHPPELRNCSIRNFESGPIAYPAILGVKKSVSLPPVSKSGTIAATLEGGASSSPVPQSVPRPPAQAVVQSDGRNPSTPRPLRAPPCKKPSHPPVHDAEHAAHSRRSVRLAAEIVQRAFESSRAPTFLKL